MPARAELGSNPHRTEIAGFGGDNMKRSRSPDWLAAEGAGPRRARVTLLLCAATIWCFAAVACQRSSEDRAKDTPKSEAASDQPEKAQPAGPPWRPGYQRPPVIDAHTHIMPSGLRRLVQIMKDNGLGLVVNVQGGSPGRGLEESVAMQQHFPGIVDL